MKMKYITIFAVCIICLAFCGCNDIAKKTGEIVEIVNPPKYVITSRENREGYEGADRVGYVDVTVTNEGGAGKGEVTVKVIQGSEDWTKTKTVNLGNGESTTANFRFKEIHFWTLDAWTFQAWVK